MRVSIEDLDPSNFDQVMEGLDISTSPAAMAGGPFGGGITTVGSSSDNNVSTITSDNSLDNTIAEMFGPSEDDETHSIEDKSVIKLSEESLKDLDKVLSEFENTEESSDFAQLIKNLIG